MTQEREQQIPEAPAPEKRPRKSRAKSGGQQQQSQRPPEQQQGGMPQQGDSQRDRPPAPDPMEAADGTGRTPPATNEENVAPV